MEDRFSCVIEQYDEETERKLNNIQKEGFKEAGRLREAKIVCRNKYDEVYMDILAKEFKSPYIRQILENKINS